MKNQVFSGMLVCLLEVVVGILLLIDPMLFTSGIAIAAGIVLCLVGIRSIVVYFRTEAEAAAKGSDLTIGLGGLLLGGFLVSNSSVVVAITPVLTVVYGIVILAGGLAKVQTTVNMLRLKRQRWYVGAVAAIVSLTCAAVILLNPFASAEALWIFMGITLIVEAVLDLLSAVFGRKTRPVQQEAAQQSVEKETPEEVQA